MEIMKHLGGSLNKMGFEIRKRSPEILVATYIITGIGCLICACEATTKVETILEKKRIDLDTIENVIDSGDDDYTEEDKRKDVAIVYARTGVELIKLYAPAIVLGAVSITSVLASSNILQKRNVALSAAYATVSEGYKKYRAGVVERFGEQIDKELKYNIKAKKFEGTETDENGKTKKVKRTVAVADANGRSDYARFFDAGCDGWDSEPEYALTFLKSRQSIANNLLQTKRHLFLNEVYDMLGMSRTEAGQIVGWTYEPENPKHTGNNYIDFGIFDTNRECDDGYEQVFLLDFNVDGPIIQNPLIHFKP